MKYLLITYRFNHGSEADWHREIARFIAALDDDPVLKGRISYRCMKARGSSEYYHLAAAADDAAVQALQSRDFFSHYTAQTELVAGGEVVVTPLELIAQTAASP